MADDFDESLDRLYCNLTDRAPARADFAWPKERAFIDCYEASGGFGGGGLYSFWSADHPQRRIIRSFERVGARRIAELLAESAWAEKLVALGDYDNREEEFGAERFSEFRAIERKIFDEMEGLIPILREFVDHHNIEARPLGGLGQMLAAVTFPFRVIIPGFLEGLRKERRNPSIDR
jgi:hypothetical protein